MALFATRPFAESLLDLGKVEEDDIKDAVRENHIFEPEFHLPLYVDPGKRAQASKNAFQLGDASLLGTRKIGRGLQPEYADDLDDPATLEFEGMIGADGKRLDSAKGTRNVCALKSVCVRSGYIDTEVARSVSRDFYNKK